MGLLKNILIGGAAGAAGGMLNRQDATNRWNLKDMYQEPDRWGRPFFQRRISDDVGRIFEQFDVERWEAMGRNYARSFVPEGMLHGALLGAAGTMLARDRRFRLPEQPPPRVPPRMPHPDGGGLGIHGHVAAPAA